MPRILVVDDDVTVRSVLATYLRAKGHQAIEAGTGEAALEAMSTHPADLVILDLMLPGMDGLEVARRLRVGAAVPIIMLTALGGEADRVAGLELGADDYVGKPFSPRELVLRVESVLRRTGAPSGGGVVTDGDVVVDGDRHLATRQGVELALTAREFALLRYLITHPNTAHSREDLLQHVWGWTIGDRSTVTVHVRRLREKIEDDPTRPTRLLTVWGVGYRWEASP